MSAFVYTRENINFIIGISVVMATIVVMGTLISILLARRRNRDLCDPSLESNGYTLTSDIVDVWSVQGHYNPIVTWLYGRGIEDLDV